MGKGAALFMNINASKGLHEVMKTNLGPKGTIKMLVGGSGGRPQKANSISIFSLEKHSDFVKVLQLLLQAYACVAAISTGSHQTVRRGDAAPLIWLRGHLAT